MFLVSILEIQNAGCRCWVNSKNICRKKLVWKELHLALSDVHVKGQNKSMDASTGTLLAL